MTLYAELSAVLAWLLDEPDGQAVRERLAKTDIVVASDLTLIECGRVSIRAAALGELTEAEAADRRGRLTTAAAHWHVLRIAGEIVERAREPFPTEPIRTLDAIHLGIGAGRPVSCTWFELLSLDERIRNVARKLGLPLQP